MNHDYPVNTEKDHGVHGVHGVHFSRQIIKYLDNNIMSLS